MHVRLRHSLPSSFVIVIVIGAISTCIYVFGANTTFSDRMYRILKIPVCIPTADRGNEKAASALQPYTPPARETEVWHGHLAHESRARRQCYVHATAAGIICHRFFA